MAWASEMMLTLTCDWSVSIIRNSDWSVSLTWGEAMCTLSWPPTSSLTVAVNLVLVFITWGGNGIKETGNSIT